MVHSRHRIDGNSHNGRPHQLEYYYKNKHVISCHADFIKVSHSKDDFNVHPYPIERAAIDDIVRCAAGAEAAILPGDNNSATAIHRRRRKRTGSNSTGICEDDNRSHCYCCLPSSTAICRSPGDDSFHSSG